MTKDELCEKALHHYGHLFQLTMMEEECAELIQACTKVSRGMSIHSLIEEIGDVENMIMQMKYDIKHLYKVDVDWNENRNWKLKRLEEMLNLSDIGEAMVNKQKEKEIPFGLGVPAKENPPIERHVQEHIRFR